MAKPKSEKPKREEKSIAERQLDMVAIAIANSAISSIKAAAIWMPDELHTYKEGYLLKFVIEKLENSF